MKKAIRLLFEIGLISLFTLQHSYAQTAADTANLHLTALNNAKACFNQTIGEQSTLYNGPMYFPYNPNLIRGSAYFQQTTTSSGNVYYDGAAFTGIVLIYDLYKDELVTLLYDGQSYFSLLKARVQNFDLLNHHFINIDADTLINQAAIKSGYYEEFYHGRQQVLGRITLGVQQVLSSTGSMEAYTVFAGPTEVFYIRKDNVYYKISGEAPLLDVLKDKKKQLQKYIRANKIKFSKDPGKAMASVSAYYDHLSN